MERITGNFFSDIFNSVFDGAKPVENKNSGGLFSETGLYPQMSEWRTSPMFLQNGTDKQTDGKTDAGETFWVRKGADGKEIAENLLRENFHFEDADVQSFKELYGNFTVFDEKQCQDETGKACGTATKGQINKWETSADKTKVAVALPKETIKTLRDFRQERLIERRVSDIADPQLRGQVEKGLKAVATQTGERRINALVNLSNVLETNSADGMRTRGIIKLVAGLPENAENPFTQILLAKVELKELDTVITVTTERDGGAGAIEKRINYAADLVAGYDDAKRAHEPNKAFSRLEAQMINEEAARLTDKLNKPAESRFRTLLARFYSVDDTERAKYESALPGLTTLPRIKDSENAAFTAEPKETLEYEQFLRDNPPQDSNEIKNDLGEDPQKREWKTRQSTDGRGGIKTEAYKQFQIEGSLKPEGVQETTDYIHFNKKGERVNKGLEYERRMPVTSRETTQREELNRAGTVRASVVGGAAATLNEINRWTPIIADKYYGTTAKRVDKFLTLKKADFDAHNFPIPPKPEKIQ